MVASDDRPAFDVLTSAARRAGFDPGSAVLIRDGANVLYRLDGVVARIGRSDTVAAAGREVAVSRWLDQVGVRVVRAVQETPQPTVVDDRPVTWWELLPPHRPASPGELGSALRELHSLPLPEDLDLPMFDPFAGLDERLAAAEGLPADDLVWLRHQLTALRRRYAQLPEASERRVVHGDAWQGNIAVPEDSPPIILDLEHVAEGPPEWDLIALAVDHTDFDRLTEADYRAFLTGYGGPDITTWPTYRLYADIQEFRWLGFALSKTPTSTTAVGEAHHRIACLRGERPRPWTWHAM